MCTCVCQAKLEQEKQKKEAEEQQRQMQEDLALVSLVSTALCCTKLANGDNIIVRVMFQ